MTTEGCSFWKRWNSSWFLAQSGFVIFLQKPGTYPSWRRTGGKVQPGQATNLSQGNTERQTTIYTEFRLGNLNPRPSCYESMVLPLLPLHHDTHCFMVKVSNNEVGLSTADPWSQKLWMLGFSKGFPLDIETEHQFISVESSITCICALFIFLSC